MYTGLAGNLGCQNQALSEHVCPEGPEKRVKGCNGGQEKLVGTVT